MPNDPSEAVPYGLAPEFERALATAAACRPALYGLVVAHLVPAAIQDPTAALVLRAVQAIGKEMHRGPTSFVTVAMRLHRWLDEGRVTQEEIDAVGDMVTEGGDEPTTDELVNELKPILELRAHKAALELGVSQYGKRGDMNEVRARLDAASRIGVVSAATGLRLGVGLAENMAGLAAGGRLGTGITDLDLALGGGPPSRSVTLAIAPTGGGKSMWLIQRAAHSLLEGHFVAYATMELPMEFIQARLVSNIVDVPTNAILDLSMVAEADERIAELAPTMGQLVIQDFPSGTLVADLRDWVRELEREEGRKVTHLVVDYIDEMGSERRDDKDDYSRQGTIMAGLDVYAKEHNHWCDTASQAKRRGPQDRKRRVYTDDVSDSLKKVQKASVVIGISTPDDDALTVEFNIAKNRWGQKDIAVGPLPHNYAHGQIVARGASL